MKNKGFTLIELLAVLIIMMLLITITVPLLSNRIKETREKTTEAQVKYIEYSAKKYVTDNLRELDELNKYGFMNITLKTLIDTKYIEENIKNPDTNKTLFLDDVIYVTMDYNNKIDVSYNIDQSKISKITLKGYFNDKVKLNNTYTDPGAIGFDGVTTNPDVKAFSGTVNTSKEGVYVLEYRFNDSLTIKRNVIVTNDL